MTHFAIVASPVPGHFDPLKILAAKLIDRGHEVTFVHLADAARMVVPAGFAFAAVGEHSHGPGALDRFTGILAKASRPLGFFAMIRATAGLTEMLLRDLPAVLVRLGAEAVIADATEPAAGLVARHLGLPFVTTMTGLPLLREPSVPPPFIGWPYLDDAAGLKRNAVGYRIADVLQRPITRALRLYGQEWGVDPDDHGGFSPLLQVAQCPPGLDFPRRALPSVFHYCGPWRAGRGEAPDIPQDRPLVYCSLGSLQGNRPAVFAAMTEACARLGLRAVVAHGGKLDERSAKTLPGDPVVRAHWDQPAVLPLCSAAILHAGFNTVLDALAAGVPMLTAPIAFEQPGTAARVAHVGAGRILKRPLKADAIAAALCALLADPRHRSSAQILSLEINSLDGADGATALIEAALATAAPPAAATTAPTDTGDAHDDNPQNESR